MSLVLSLVVMTTHAGLLSEDVPRSARLMVEESPLVVAQADGTQLPPPPPPPPPPPAYGPPPAGTYAPPPAGYAPPPPGYGYPQTQYAPAPQQDLAAQRAALLESMPSLVVPIVLIGVGAGLLISSYFLAYGVLATPVFGIIALAAIIAGGVMVAVGTPMLIVRIVNRAKIQRRINNLDAQMRSQPQPQYAPPPPATLAPSEFAPLYSFNF